MRRCEREAWPISKRTALFRGAIKFAGLYFAVVALGAINASPNETALLDHFYHQFKDPDKTLPPETRFSALDFAKFYFDIAKQALGDLFESSCLETAQALFLMVCLCEMQLKFVLLRVDFRVFSVRIRCSRIVAICIVEWLCEQRRLLGWLLVCLLYPWV
jgi:hypothetical protein